MGRAQQARNIWAKKTNTGTKESAWFKGNIEQRGAARKCFSVSHLSAAGASENQVFISRQLHPPPAFAFDSGVFLLQGRRVQESSVPRLPAKPAGGDAPERERPPNSFSTAPLLQAVAGCRTCYKQEWLFLRGSAFELLFPYLSFWPPTPPPFWE